MFTKNRGYAILRQKDLIEGIWMETYTNNNKKPEITVIIPSYNVEEYIGECLESLKKQTFTDFEVLCVDDGSDDRTVDIIKEYAVSDPRFQYVGMDHCGKAGLMRNEGIKRAKGEYLLFLNNDVEIITESWLEEMLQLCQQKDVGMVGAKLYYPDDTIQHAGVVVGLGGVAAHVLCKLPRDAEGYMGRLRCVQEISAVTAACMMVKTSVFKAVGGFDEELKVAFNDIDLCMKVRKYGVKIVFTPYAELYHYESKSRGMEDTPEKQLRFSREVNCFRRKWERELLKGDPYYNPNLTLNNTDCSLRKQEKNGD